MMVQIWSLQYEREVIFKYFSIQNPLCEICKDLYRFLHMYAPVLILHLQISSATHELHFPELHFCVV